jgi:hypothetical protein
MKLFFSELEYLRELYGRLEGEITAAQQHASELDAAELAEAVLKNRDLLRRIDQMNSRVLQLVEEWQTFKLSIREEQRTEIQNLAQSVSRKGWELHASCTRALTSLSARVRKLQEELSEVGRGNRFLDSVKPVRGNYPKFVDSVG